MLCDVFFVVAAVNCCICMICMNLYLHKMKASFHTQQAVPPGAGQGRMIIDTSWMEVGSFCVFVYFRKIFFFLPLLVRIFVCVYLYVFANTKSKQFPQCRPGQDDYRHKLDGSRPIMDVPPARPLLQGLQEIGQKYRFQMILSVQAAQDFHCLHPAE